MSCRQLFRTNRSIALAGVAIVLALACAERRDAGANGAVARAAPGCVALGAPVAVDSNALTENVRGGREYACTLGTDGPEIRVTLVADSAANLISSVSVQRDTASAPFQTLTEGQTEPPYRGAEVLTARDFDGDGYLDLMLLAGWGVTGNNSYNVWRWNASTEQFAFDSTLSSLTSPTLLPGRACVASRSTGGDAGGIYKAVTVCLERGAWAIVSAERQDWSPRLRAHIRSVLERRGDSLVVTRVDTIRAATDR